MTVCTDPLCARLSEVYGERTHLTIRDSTEAEREHIADFWATGNPMRAQRYLIVEADNPESWLGAFGLVDGGDTREEAVFWAERWADKNGGHFLRPDGWEDVVGALPEQVQP
jgi:hypothetical protein